MAKSTVFFSFFFSFLPTLFSFIIIILLLVFSLTCLYCLVFHMIFFLYLATSLFHPPCILVTYFPSLFFILLSAFFFFPLLNASSSCSSLFPFSLLAYFIRFVFLPFASSSASSSLRLRFFTPSSSSLHRPPPASSLPFQFPHRRNPNLSSLPRPSTPPSPTSHAITHLPSIPSRAAAHKRRKNTSQLSSESVTLVVAFQLSSLGVHLRGSLKIKLRTIILFPARQLLRRGRRRSGEGGAPGGGWRLSWLLGGS